MTVWDLDGPGPAAHVLTATGNFSAAGSTTLNYVAQWNGTQWLPLAAGIDSTGLAIGTFDPDGVGPLISSLVVGGVFTHASSHPANAIASWDGTQWHALGTGIGGTPLPEVWGLGQYGANLYAGGIFGTAGGATANSVARWDGATWYSLQDDRATGPRCFADYQSQLIAGGHFANSSGNPFITGVLAWTGQAWVALATGFPSWDVYALTTYRGCLIAGGSFSTA